MEFDFLKDFPKRMKKVGMYTLINYNSMMKGTWKTYGLEESHEHVNLIFAVLMYIMEQSLKDEICTMDDIASYIDDVNSRFFRKNLSYEMCKSLGDFIVNTVLCDDGKAMYFKGYDFQNRSYTDIHMAYVNNKIEYINDSTRRTSYYLTEDGYSLLLGTLEIENNMKLTIHEMIFKLHLDKADYDKAVDDIKHIFDLSRIQLQKIEESIRRIKANVLNFSSDEYESMLDENMELIREHRSKYELYRQHVNEKIEEFYEQDIDLDKLEDDNRDKLGNLGTINKYLSRVIGEQQKILSTHFDFKKAYTDALTGMTSMAVIRRINLGSDLYEHILRDAGKLGSLDRLLRPLYLASPSKHYNINKCIQYQRSIKSREEETEEEIDLDEESLREEKERELRKKLLKYKGVLEILMDRLAAERDGRLSLKELADSLENDIEAMRSFVPSVEIFREVMVELLKSSFIDIPELKNEAVDALEEEQAIGFELNRMLLAIVEENRRYKNIKSFEAYKLTESSPVKIYGVPMESGYVKTVSCSNIEFKVEVAR